jgi:hypothetical protein
MQKSKKDFTHTSPFTSFNAFTDVSAPSVLDDEEGYRYDNRLFDYWTPSAPSSVAVGAIIHTSYFQSPRGSIVLTFTGLSDNLFFNSSLIKRSFACVFEGNIVHQATLDESKSKPNNGIILGECELPPKWHIHSTFNLTGFLNFSFVPFPPIETLTALLFPQPLPHKIVHCMSPLWGSKLNNYLVEWIEFHRLMGVEHFVSYDFNVTKEGKQVLQYYQQQGLFTVFDWSITANFKGWYLNQMAAWQHCLSTFRYNSSFLVFTDVDEFILPMNNT